MFRFCKQNEFCEVSSPTNSFKRQFWRLSKDSTEAHCSNWRDYRSLQHVIWERCQLGPSLKWD